MQESEMVMAKAYTKETAFGAGLDTRACIWWGTLCAWDWFRNRQASSVKDALDVCVRWYQNPTEENRAQAGQLLDTGNQSPAISMLLRAVFYTGNVAPKDCPPVNLHADMPRKMVASCLDMLLAKAPVVQREEHVARFEQLLQEISPTSVHTN